MHSMSTPTARSGRTRSGLARLASAGALTVAGAAAAIGAAAPAQAADTGIPVLEEIKQCESGGDYQAQNPNSSASGAYQFMDFVWDYLGAGDGYATPADAPEHVQDAAAVELYNEFGVAPWLPSAHCWAG